MLALLIERCNSGKVYNYLPFYGHRVTKRIGKNCLSQFYPTAFSVDGVMYTHAERFMMAEKARLFDPDAVAGIMAATTPYQVKMAGRRVRNFDNDVWNQHKFQIVVDGNYAKFSQNPLLREYLLSTGNDVLVEAAPNDRVWGVGLACDDERINRPQLWMGENLLGFALMVVRGMLRQ